MCCKKIFIAVPEYSIWNQMMEYAIYASNSIKFSWLPEKKAIDFAGADNEILRSLHQISVHEFRPRSKRPDVVRLFRMDYTYQDNHGRGESHTSFSASSNVFARMQARLPDVSPSEVRTESRLTKTCCWFKPENPFKRPPAYSQRLINLPDLRKIFWLPPFIFLLFLNIRGIFDLCYFSQGCPKT